MSMVRDSRKELNEKFSEKQDAEIQRLLAKGTVPDDQLDLSDIPEITDWNNAVRHNQFYRPVKQQTSIRLDADVLAWFKAQGKGYQTRMNEILRDAMLKELKVSEYTALQIKQAVVGNGHARKNQVQEMVMRLLNLTSCPTTDAADALACAICHAHGGFGLGKISIGGYRMKRGRLV